MNHFYDILNQYNFKQKGEPFHNYAGDLIYTYETHKEEKRVELTFCSSIKGVALRNITINGKEFRYCGGITTKLKKIFGGE